MLRDRERRMRTGSLRGAPLAGLVSAYHAVHVGPCSVIRVASAWRKKLPTRKCGSAYPNCAICSPRCYGAGGTALNTCCIGPSGEDDINSTPCAATIESADRLCLSSIYNCSTKQRSGLPHRRETLLLPEGSGAGYPFRCGGAGLYHGNPWQSPNAIPFGRCASTRK